MAVFQTGGQVSFYEVVMMEMCASCSHIAVCKYLEDAMDVDNTVKELNARDIPIKAKLECDQYRPRTTNIKAAE